MWKLLLALPLLWIALAARAEVPRDLMWPIVCQPGVDCWILRYVDQDPTAGVEDYRCGRLSGDGHKGTDIAIRDLAVMANGVAVRAAASGVVGALRDGMADVSVEEDGRESIAGKACGNGIRLDHGDGWSTWYCHLRRGSLMVEEGDAVAAGQPLALVGLSGETTFPHLHFDVRHGEAIVDPFVGLEGGERCQAGTAPLWRTDVMARLDYQPVILSDAGFAPRAPVLEDVRRGYHREAVLSVASPALVLWVQGYWVEAGDQVRFRLIGPDASPVLDEVIEVEDGQRRWLQYAGSRRPGTAWPTGAYAGEITLERDTPDGPVRIVLDRAVELR